MAELRHTVRAYAVEGHPPGVVLRMADSLMRRLLPGELATICAFTIHPSSGRIRLANAGHPPPLLVQDDGAARFIDHPAPLLGIDAPRPEDLELELPPGGTLVLYTDGLIERRDSDIDEGMRRLAVAALVVDDDLQRFCDRIVAELAGPAINDDIAVVAIRRRAQ
jgi:serine phosphatase RsbU (regulator of sigma subunit)